MISECMRPEEVYRIWDSIASFGDEDEKTWSRRFSFSKSGFATQARLDHAYVVKGNI